MRSVLTIYLLLLVACASAPKLNAPAHFSSEGCQRGFDDARHLPTEKQLDQVITLFSSSCFEETIQLGRYIRLENHDKFYSVSSEFFELFAPEGSVTPYVLESYERGYLSLLISLAYFRLNHPELAAVELRRANLDEKALLYNYGDDPVVALLEAAILDHVNPAEARPFWKRLSEFRTNSEVQNFALHRLHEIDSDSSSPLNWKIYSCGKLPDYDWKMSASRFYKITPKTYFPISHADSNSLSLSTESWDEKIEGRYRSGYHHYLFTKSVMRLTTGIAYGVLGVAAGATIGVGGCIAGGECKK